MVSTTLMSLIAAGSTVKRVLVEDDQIGELPTLKRALRGLLHILVRGIDGDGFQRFEGSDALVGANDHTVTGDAIHGSPHHEHLIKRGDYEVGVIGGTKALVDGSAHGAFKKSLFLATIQYVGVSKIKSVLREKRRDHFISDVFVELIGAYELRVDDGDMAILQ